MDNEDFVRLHWKAVKKTWKDGDSYGADVFTVWLGAEPEQYNIPNWTPSFSGSDYNAVWARAAEFTKGLLGEAKQLDEAIVYLQELEGCGNPHRQITDFIVRRLKVSLEVIVNKGLKFTPTDVGYCEWGV